MKVSDATHIPTHPFGVALACGDIDAAVGLLSDNVTLHSPVAFKPYHGRAATAAILQAVSVVLKDFHYVCEIGADDAANQALVFRARIGDREIEGCDFLHRSNDDLIDQLTVMTRPLSATMALREAMAGQLAPADAS